MKIFLRIPAIGLLFLFFAFTAHSAVLTVTKIADTNDGICDADCSLREAVATANASVENDIIVFGQLFLTPRTITLGGSEILFAASGSLELLGPGASRLTVSGGNASRIFRSAVGVNVLISGMRLTGGNGVSTVTNNSGGAILNDSGTMTLQDMIISNNTTTGGAGGVRNSGTNSVMFINRCIFANNTSTTSSAGGLQNFSTSTLTVVDSTFSGNVSGGGTVGGGAMQANGMVTISNSTFSGNISNTNGGGGAINSNGTLLLLTNVTITANTSLGNGGGLHRSTTNVNGFIRNSIIAGNTGVAASPDVTNSAGGLMSQGNNIIGAVGTSTGWIASDLLNVNPLLSPLGFYGGFGMTHLPLNASPAINAGQNCVVNLSCGPLNPPTALVTDQRGAARPFGPAVDIGAVEVSSDYVATLPIAGAGAPYSFTIAPVTSGFTYVLNTGTLGGLALTSTAAATLGGVPSVPGTFSGLVQIMGGAGQVSQNYRINVLANPGLVSVSGRVLDAMGRPVKGARVVITGFDGSTYVALTNPFGYFRIDGVTAGLNGQIAVSSKSFDFAPRPIFVNEVTEGLIFSPVPPPPPPPLQGDEADG